MKYFRKPAHLVILFLIYSGCSNAQKIIQLSRIENIRWTHSHEDDEGAYEIYRPHTYNFPPSRGRRGFEFLGKNQFKNYAIAPADGIETVAATWEKIADNKFRINFSDTSKNYTIEFISLKKKKLKVKISN